MIVNHKFHSSILSKEKTVKEPIVITVNDFNEISALFFSRSIKKAHNTGQTVIPVIIDSYGGEIYSLIGMIADIENSQLPVATIIKAKAMSCGAFLFAFGTEGYRYASEDSAIMIHDITSGTSGNIEDIKADVHHTEGMQKTMFRKMAKHIGQKPNFFLDMLKKNNYSDIFLTAQEAKKIKLVNHIKVPSLEVNVDVTYKFE